jgi:hypothetical protein
MKKKFEKDLYENAKKNPKAIRSYIKSKSKTGEGIGDLHIDPEDTNSEKDLCSRSLKRVKKVDQLVSMLLVSLSTLYLAI